MGYAILSLSDPSKSETELLRFNGNLLLYAQKIANFSLEKNIYTYLLDKDENSDEGDDDCHYDKNDCEVINKAMF